MRSPGNDCKKEAWEIPWNTAKFKRMKRYILEMKTGKVENIFRNVLVTRFIH